jgi:hypothetical protein
MCRKRRPERFRKRNVFSLLPEIGVYAMAQLALFPEQSAGPAGLRYQPEFVSETSESELISRISELPLQPFQFGAFEGKRRVASFGFRYDYTLKRIQEADPIPAWLISIASSVGLPGRQVCSPSKGLNRSRGRALRLAANTIAQRGVLS